MAIERIEPGVRFSEVVTFGNLVFLAGHTASDMDGDVYEQTRDVLRQIDEHLAAGGSDKSRLLSVSIWLSDIGTFGEMNRAWDEWLDRDNMPVRATVEARLAKPGWKVEIAGIAAR
jgi:enamine deaminase RidA (YjgF/YER057c/UK114 family)